MCVCVFSSRLLPTRRFFALLHLLPFFLLLLVLSRRSFIFTACVRRKGLCIGIYVYYIHSCRNELPAIRITRSNHKSTPVYSSIKKKKKVVATVIPNLSPRDRPGPFRCSRFPGNFILIFSLRSPGTPAVALVAPTCP